jgi:hypothetical protein
MFIHLDLFTLTTVLPAYAAVGTVYARIHYRAQVRKYYAAAVQAWKDKNGGQDMTPAGMQQIDTGFHSVGQKKLSGIAFDKGIFWPVALVGSFIYSTPKAEGAEADARKEVENARLRKKIEHMEAVMEKEAQDRLAILEADDGKKGWDIV